MLVSHVSEESFQIPGIFLPAFNLSLMAMARMPAMPHASFYTQQASHPLLFTSHPSCIWWDAFLQDCGRWSCFFSFLTISWTFFVWNPWSLVSEPQAFPERQGASLRHPRCPEVERNCLKSDGGGGWRWRFCTRNGVLNSWKSEICKTNKAFKAFKAHKSP